jgi:hypothetical protein
MFDVFGMDGFCGMMVGGATTWRVELMFRWQVLVAKRVRCGPWLFFQGFGGGGEWNKIDMQSLTSMTQHHARRMYIFIRTL